MFFGISAFPTVKNGWKPLKNETTLQFPIQAKCPTLVYLNSSDSYLDVAVSFRGITSKLALREDIEDLLPKQKGRPSMSKKKK
ncbi:hypothetical protein AX25_05470 [Listeria ivanovii WSLC3009]|nr:hypothetical protein AX25_05470 [Listeria ivanovii WSLC3009]